MKSKTALAETWTALRAAAMEAAAWGWPVLPATHVDHSTGRWCGTANATDLYPITPQWVGTGMTDPAIAEQQWTQQPFGVLLECGRGVDVLELPARLAEQALPALSRAGLFCPVAVLLHPARWLLFTDSGQPAAQLRGWPGVPYRGAGAWVPLPPTNLGTSYARWHMKPELSSGKQLADPAEVELGVIDALGRRTDS